MKKMPGEPEFALLARDRSAPDMVRQWAFERERAVERGSAPASDTDQIARARMLAAEMEVWRIANEGKWREPVAAPAPNLARDVMLQTFEEQLGAIKTGVLGGRTVKVIGIQSLMIIEDIDTGRTVVVSKDAGVFPVAPGARWASVDDLKGERDGRPH
jgi:hypothetical protein